MDAPGDISWRRSGPCWPEGGLHAEGNSGWTHGHWDHTPVMAAAVKPGETRLSRFRAHRDDQALLSKLPRSWTNFMGASKLGIEPRKGGSRWMKQGEKLKALGPRIRGASCAGSLSGQRVVLLRQEAKAAFVGDALFNRGVGRWDFPGGDFELLAKSIREQIYTLPDETIVFPGHGPRTTVGAEKSGNPYVSAIAAHESNDRARQPPSCAGRSRWPSAAGVTPTRIRWSAH